MAITAPTPRLLARTSHPGTATAAASLVRRAWRTNPSLTLVAGASICIFVGTLLGLLLDPRVITGAPAWLKPAKFALSIGIYSATFLWLLRFVQGHARSMRAISGITAAMALGELLIIALQALRGTTSHFNLSTPLDTALWASMGIMISVLWIANAVAAVLLMRQPLVDRALAWSLRLSLVLALVGMAVAVPMAVSGAHTVGLADGGPGLPLVGWSTVGGDLRVAHFVGLHALQALPLLAWLVDRTWVGLSAQSRLRLVWALAGTYLGVILVLTWQALRGQSLIAPDSTTLAACGALMVAAVLSVGLALYLPRDGTPVARLCRPELV